jgi:hypothetical protein
MKELLKYGFTDESAGTVELYSFELDNGSLWVYGYSCNVYYKPNDEGTYQLAAEASVEQVINILKAIQS